MKIIKSRDLINYRELEKAHYNKISSERILKFIINHNLHDNFSFYQDKYSINYEQYLLEETKFITLNKLKSNWEIDFDKKELILHE